MKKKPDVRVSVSGLFRSRLDEFESRMTAGIRQDVLVAGLKKEGYPLTLAEFRQYLYLARKYRQKMAAAPASLPAQVPAGPVRPEVRHKSPVSPPPVKPASTFRYTDTANPEELY